LYIRLLKKAFRQAGQTFKNLFHLPKYAGRAFPPDEGGLAAAGFAYAGKKRKSMAGKGRYRRRAERSQAGCKTL